MDSDPLYESLRTGSDKTAPPIEIFRIVEAAFDDLADQPDAVYTEATDQDHTTAWTVLAICGDAMLRATGSADWYKPDHTNSLPNAVLFPLDVKSVTPIFYSNDRTQWSVTWSATIAGPDGQPITLDLPGQGASRYEGQRAKAHGFALALRDRIVRRMR